MSSTSLLNWRVQLLKDAQKRFEQQVIAPALKDVKQLRANFNTKVKSAKSPLEVNLIQSELKRLDRTERRINKTLERSKDRFETKLNAATVGAKPKAKGRTKKKTSRRSK